MANKLALLVGCNYSNNPDVPDKYKLHGCISDVKAMQALIQSLGFQNITILTDEPETEKAPTSSIIIEELETKVNATKPGDTLLFFFSGGGELVKPMATEPATATDTATATVITATATANATARGTSTATATATASPTATSTAAKTMPTPTPTPTPRATADTKKGISAIIPCDLKPITAADILPIINRLPDKTIFIFVSDSSYSGGLFKESVQIQHNVPDPGPNLRRKTIPGTNPSNVGGRSAAGSSLNGKILFSSSKANEESVEVYPNGDRSKAFGGFSNFIQTLNPSVPVFDILGFHQHPYLDYCME